MERKEGKEGAGGAREEWEEGRVVSFLIFGLVIRVEDHRVREEASDRVKISPTGALIKTLSVSCLQISDG